MGLPVIDSPPAWAHRACSLERWRASSRGLPRRSGAMARSRTSSSCGAFGLDGRGAMSAGFRFHSHSPEQTRDLASMLARVIDERGVVVALEGPLGAGKTVFVKGLAAGLEIDPSSVSSPTFVIASEYEGRGPDGSPRRLIHADLYRVGSAAELEGAGYLDWIVPGHVVAVEWAERALRWLPRDHLRVSLETLGRDRRRLHVQATGPRSVQLATKWVEAGGFAVQLA
ncbi:MAG TPA: tRNA (adenosine(37)-N6)-threonylcarbamoyltransferase complex ATPase subunit type 1 TsaE [Deltaproteobacteria bacterium]|nr:tRNA (adenosine(37)-N6)-threonylcarbamoyltransferase complex ATPase subunit type 1 TsaE [Deltaproteobacteria bacterium]